MRAGRGRGREQGQILGVSLRLGLSQRTCYKLTWVSFVCCLLATVTREEGGVVAAGLELTSLLQQAAMCAGTPLRCLGLWH